MNEIVTCYGEPMPVTAQEVRERNNADVVAALDKAGITLDYLVKQLKRELKAYTTRTVKFKGKPETGPNGKPILAKGVHVLAQGYKQECGKAGEVYDDGDTVIAINEIAHDVRQKARMDAHKLRGDYAPDKHEHSFGDESDLEKAAIAALKDMVEKRREAGQ